MTLAPSPVAPTCKLKDCNVRVSVLFCEHLPSQDSIDACVGALLATFERWKTAFGVVPCDARLCLVGQGQWEPRSWLTSPPIQEGGKSFRYRLEVECEPEDEEALYWWQRRFGSFLDILGNWSEEEFPVGLILPALQATTTRVLVEGSGWLRMNELDRYYGPARAREIAQKAKGAGTLGEDVTWEPMTWEEQKRHRAMIKPRNMW